MGIAFNNINFYSNIDQTIEFSFNSDTYELQLKKKNGDFPDIKEVIEFESYELNGFIWDDLNMFDKFNPKLPNRSFSKISDNCGIKYSKFCRSLNTGKIKDKLIFLLIFINF